MSYHPYTSIFRLRIGFVIRKSMSFCRITYGGDNHGRISSCVDPDYHLALLPLLIKQRRPDAKVALFWHILAKARILWNLPLASGDSYRHARGRPKLSHTIFPQYFLDTVDRFLESQMDWEQFSSSKRHTQRW